MSYGEIIRELRGTRTQEGLAKELGITKSSLAMYERNERVPRDEVKIKIANYFGKTVQEIFLIPLSTYSTWGRHKSIRRTNK